MDSRQPVGRGRAPVASGRYFDPSLFFDAARGSQSGRVAGSGAYSNSYSLWASSSGRLQRGGAIACGQQRAMEPPAVITLGQATASVGLADRQTVGIPLASRSQPL